MAHNPAVRVAIVAAFIGQAPIGAVFFVAAIVVAATAGYVWALRFVDGHRPELRDPLALTGLLAGIAILAFSTFSFLTGAPESASFAPVPATLTAVLVALLGLWWWGYGRPVLVLGGLGSAVAAFAMFNPMTWAFVGEEMLWVVALAVALLTATVLGRYGRSFAAQKRARLQKQARYRKPL